MSAGDWYRRRADAPRPMKRSPAAAAEKAELHPRNPHRSRYDFERLVQVSPELGLFVRPNKFSADSIDFADPAAVKALNRALLRQYYDIHRWDLPAGYLCPPIPGRADYLHYVADLLASSNRSRVPRGAAVTALDVGVGANCIYPIIGHQTYGWRFVGSEVDAAALRSAQQIAASNPGLAGAVECRLQRSRTAIFRDIIRAGECFDVTLCNPPFHASAAEAAAGTLRKITNLGTGRGAGPVLNFGGQNAELWCAGGEQAFVRRMIEESVAAPCLWFTTLISKQTTLPAIHRALKAVEALDVRTITMAQGQKISRLVAWTFRTPAQHDAWRARRWRAPSFHDRR